MKLNKLIAGAAAIAMLGSLVTAVPAMAATEPQKFDLSSAEFLKYSYNRDETTSRDKGENKTFSFKSTSARSAGFRDYANAYDDNLTSEIGVTNAQSIIVDLGAEYNIQKITIKQGYTSSNFGAMIVGLSNDVSFTDGTLEMTSENWVRVNNSRDKKLTEYDVAYTPGELPQSSDNSNKVEVTNAIVTMTKTADTDSVYRYVILDCNGSATKCAELEVDIAPVAKIGDSDYYWTLDEAIDKAMSNDKIELLSDAEINLAHYLRKNLTIEGNEHAVKLNKVLEFNDNYSLTVSDVVFSGTAAVDMKTSTVITANNVSFNKLSLGGAGNESKGTLTSCNVANLSTYGRIILDNTSVDKVVFSNVKASGDTPCIIMMNNSTVASANLLKVENPKLPYTLFDGEGAPATITGVPEGYEYSNGVLSEKQEETQASASYKLIKSWDDETDPASAWELTVNPGTYTIDSFTLSISDGTNNYPATNSPNSTQVSDGAVVFGVAVNKAASFVKGMTLDVTSGTASSPIEATVESAE